MTNDSLCKTFTGFCGIFLVGSASYAAQQKQTTKNAVVYSHPSTECRIKDNCLLIEEDFVLKDGFRVSRYSDEFSCDGSKVVIEQILTAETGVKSQILNHSVDIYVNSKAVEVPEGLEKKLTSRVYDAPFIDFSCEPGVVFVTFLEDENQNPNNFEIYYFEIPKAPKP